jgi:hypothetical protein
LAAALADTALLTQLPHGDVLHDAVLDVFETRVIGVQDLPRVHGIEPLL